jgi:hypothetical protein
MKFTKSIIVFSILAGVAGAVAAQQQTLNGYPVPANATTGNARAVVGVAPLTTEGIAPLVTPLIPRSTPYTPAWTSFFLNQTICVNYVNGISPACATVQADGSILFPYVGYAPAPIPIGLASTGTNNCVYMAPLGMNTTLGTAPTSWSIFIDQTCASSGPG